jgi:hypothetical protein
MIKSRGMRQWNHVARMIERKKALRISTGDPDCKGQLRTSTLEEIFKRILTEKK